MEKQAEQKAGFTPQEIQEMREQEKVFKLNPLNWETPEAYQAYLNKQ